VSQPSVKVLKHRTGSALLWRITQVTVTDPTPVVLRHQGPKSPSKGKGK
jgi:hypothetical protein